MPPASFVERVSAPADGCKAAELLIAFFEKNTNISLTGGHLGDSSKELFRQTIFNACNNVAGERYSLYGEGKRNRPGFHHFVNELKERFDFEDTQQRSTFFGIIATLVKEIVFTPHPNEMLSTGSIDLEMYLENLLHNKEYNALFNGNIKNPLQNNVLDDPKRQLLETLENLFLSIQYDLPKNLVMLQEAVRATQRSEHPFKAIGIIIDQAISAIGVNEDKPLTEEELKSFGHIVRMLTWAIGDRDSKVWPAEILEFGIDINKVAMSQRYVRSLAEMIVAMEDQEIPDRQATQNALRSIMLKVMEGIPNDRRMQQYIDYLKRPIENVDARIIGEITKTYEFKNDRDAFSERERLARLYAGESPKFEQEKQTWQHKYADTPFANLDVRYVGYPNAEYLTEALLDLRRKHETLPAYLSRQGEKTNVTMLDVLITQSTCFGDYALRSQLRQNKDEHSKVMDIIREYLHKAKFIDSRDKDKWNASTLISLLDEKPDVGKFLRQKLGKIETRLRQSRTISGEASAVSLTLNKGDKKNKAEETKDNTFFHALKVFEIAANNPGSVAHYIIAECESAEDVLNVYFFLKAAVPPEKTEMRNAIEEIFPLVEYYKDFQGLQAIVKGSFEHSDFKKYHEKSAACLNQRLKVYEPESDNHRPMTVADAKRMRGYEDSIKEGDDKKIITHQYTVMFAGSDAARESGIGINPIQTAIKKRMELELLEMGVLLVEERGHGAHLGRLNLKLEAELQTEQGSAQKRSPEGFALLIERFFGMRMVQALNNIPSKYQKNTPRTKVSGENEKALIAQVNVGNFLNIKEENADARYIEERSERRRMAYHRIFYDSTLKDFLRHATPVDAASFNEFAHRPANRNWAVSLAADSYPSSANPQGVRAIKSNAMDSYTLKQMWYGFSSFLELDESGRLTKAGREKIIDLYKRSPSAQDMINRTTWGLCHANMEQSWEFLLGFDNPDNIVKKSELKRSVGEDGTVKIRLLDKTFSVNDLAEIYTKTRPLNRDDTRTLQERLAASPDNGALKGTLTALTDSFSTTSISSKEAAEKINAVLMMAEFDREYQVCMKTMFEVQSVIAAQRDGRNAVKVADNKVINAEDIIDTLPSVLRNEFTEGKRMMDNERQKLIDIHHAVLQEEIANKQELAGLTGILDAAKELLEKHELGTDAPAMDILKEALSNPNLLVKLGARFKFPKKTPDGLLDPGDLVKDIYFTMANLKKYQERSPKGYENPEFAMDIERAKFMRKAA